MMKMTITAVSPGTGNQTVINMTAPGSAGNFGSHLTLIDDFGLEAAGFVVSKEVYVILLDAQSVGGHVLATEDSFMHAMLDLVDVPRQVENHIKTLWERLAHAAMVAKLNMTQHVQNTVTAVADEMAKVENTLQSAAVAESNLTAIRHTNPDLADAVTAISTPAVNAPAVGTLTAAIGESK